MKKFTLILLMTFFLGSLISCEPENLPEPQSNSEKIENPKIMSGGSGEEDSEPEMKEEG